MAARAAAAICSAHMSSMRREGPLSGCGPDVHVLATAMTAASSVAIVMRAVLLAALVGCSSSAAGPARPDGAGGSGGGGVGGLGGPGGAVNPPGQSGAGGMAPPDAAVDVSPDAGGDVPPGDRDAGPGGSSEDDAGGADVALTDGGDPDGHDGSAGTGGAAGTDAGVDDGQMGSPDAVTMPGAVKVFDQIPQFGMYATAEPTNYTPPAGVLMWNYGSFFVTRLTDAQQGHIGADVAARITYHAQCDNYDRLASVFFLTMPKGQAPKPTDPRVELVRFITPFSDHTRGALATRVYPDVDVSTYAHALADASRDIWVGIGGGSNPYDGDPCTNANVSPEFRAIGYKFSLELVSTKPQPSGGAPTVTLPGIYYVAATTVPVAAMFDNPGDELVGRITVIVSGHGSAAGGVEYRHTQDTVSVNGKQVGTFGTEVDCAPYASLSPDGNQGIFRNNTSTANPRNWCPGAVVAPRSFPATFTAGRNTVSLGVSPADVPSGSYYSTSITFTALEAGPGDRHQGRENRLKKAQPTLGSPPAWPPPCFTHRPTSTEALQVL